ARLAVDCAVLIRGGGSRTDLAAFDSRAIAEAIARAPFPVLTGLGHEIDRSIADLAAHAAFKTPTKVAEFLNERVAGADQALEELRRSLLREALEPLRAGREALGRAERGVSLARMRLAAAGARIEEHARGRAREAVAKLQGTERLCLRLAPERTLERGFSLTRDASGRIVRQPAQVRP